MGYHWLDWLPRRWGTLRFIFWVQRATEGLNSKGAYLLQWTMIQWLKENGITWYDLGGIDPEGNRGSLSLQERIVRSRHVSFDPASGEQQRSFFCVCQGKVGRAPRCAKGRTLRRACAVSLN